MCARPAGAACGGRQRDPDLPRGLQEVLPAGRRAETQQCITAVIPQIRSCPSPGQGERHLQKDTGPSLSASMPERFIFGKGVTPPD